MPPLPLACPACRSLLLPDGPDQLACPACRQVYPLRFGIPDLRLPGLGKRDPQREAIAWELAEAYDRLSQAELTRLFFEHLDKYSLPGNVEAAYTSYLETQRQRGRNFNAMFLCHLAEEFGSPPSGAALEVGCGTGASLAPLAEGFEWAVGVDPDLPSLLLARKAMQEAGMENFQLVQAYGQGLPFAGEQFAYIMAQNTLEHLFDVDAVLAEIVRLLEPGGEFAADSRNRYDLLFKEPHVHLRWVGFLPRRWAPRYVAWRNGMRYDNTWLLSYGDLRRLLRSHFGPRRYRILFPDTAAYGGAPGVDRWLALLERGGPLAAPVKFFFPSLLVVATKRPPAIKMPSGPGQNRL